MRKRFMDKKDCEIYHQKMNNISSDKEGNGIAKGSGLNKGIAMGIYQKFNSY